MFKKTAKKPGSINLVRGMGKGLSDQLLNWSFTVLRAILMIVYSVALIAFLYRFGLDREIIDLRDKIEAERVIVSVTEKSEATYRDLQNRLTQSTQSVQDNEKYLTLLDNIIRIASGKIVFTSLEITDSTVEMEGEAISIGSLNGFIDEIKDLPEIKAATLGRLESRVGQGIVAFQLTASL